MNTTSIERPLSLTPSTSRIFGNDRSQQLVQSSFDEAFKGYCELINDGWSEENSLRSAYNTLIGSLESKVHQLSEALAIEEAYVADVQNLIHGESK